METPVLYMVIMGRINFLQLGRYDKSCEQRFRQNFSKSFDWLSFNLILAVKVLSRDRKTIAIDPRFIYNSGKHTPWISYFWSGTSNMAQRGLEILGVGLVDIDTKDCISLQAVQTPDSNTLENIISNLIDWYLFSIKSMKEKFRSASRYIVADAYFSKYSFSVGIKEMDFDLISRFKSDSVLYYPTLEKPTGKKGRPKIYGEKIDMSNLDKTRVEKIDINN